MSIFPTRILLATDGSKEADLAASTATDLAQKTDSELHVIFVVPTRTPFEYDAMGFTIEDPHEEVKEEGRRKLDGYVRRIEEAGGSVGGAHLKMGKPDDQIVHLAEELDAGLIVMGSRGLGGVRRALMGSVSDSVVRHAHCPVTIVRPEQRRAAER
ncbi:MAG TPA: universal stress protein [Rubrobacteraceae bacterium]|nr:universal stress protein [Rubrobacteraceae bacterium]